MVARQNSQAGAVQERCEWAEQPCAAALQSASYQQVSGGETRTARMSVPCRRPGGRVAAQPRDVRRWAVPGGLVVAMRGVAHACSAFVTRYTEQEQIIS